MTSSIQGNVNSAVENSQPLEEQITELLDILTVVLLEHPRGISEHTLLTDLQKPPYYFFATDALKDSLSLFQTHFMLFHCLYRLQKHWLESGRGRLQISALNVVLEPLLIDHTITAVNLNSSTLESFVKQASQLQFADPLAQYYLNLDHFTSTTHEDVTILLAGAWKKLFNPVSSGCFTESLALMELTLPLTLADLKAQYRRLAQRYHPDKGGDDEHFKAICRAYHQLKHHEFLNEGTQP
jgi:hypothetical protein